MPADVLCLSHLRWGFVYQRPNHLMSRCAQGRRVYFVEEPTFGAHTPHLATQKTPEGVIVVVPHLRDDDAGAGADAGVKRLLDRFVEDQNIQEPLLWFYTPMALAYAGHLRAKVTVYDCMDELSLFRGAPPELLQNEEELLRRADLVFTGGESLYEAKRGRNPHVHAFPSSVDAAHFARARQGSALPTPVEEAALPAPRVGYFGVVDERIDLDLVAALADTHPSWSVVVVGPVVKIDPRDLPQRANVHYLGGKSYEDLPAHLAAWDVAIMPFAENEATRFISPTKTLEYLAAGKPVVSTPIRDVVRPYGDEGLVRVGTGAGFVAHVAAAMDERGTEAAESRRALADAFVAKTSWDRTWKRMDGLIEDVASRRRRERETKDETKGARQCSTT